MEAKIDQLASSITSLIRSFLQTEVGEYRENYEYMLNSPLCRKLLGEIDRLKKENQVLSSQERPNIELEIMEEVESPYEFDRKYKDDTSVSTKFAQIKPKEQVPEEVEVTDEEEGLGDASQEEEEGEEVEVTDQEEGEEVEITDEEEGLGDASQEEEEGEEVEETEEEEGLGEASQEEEEVEVTDEEEGLGDASQEEEEEEEEEEVFEFEYKGVMYFATDEVNGVLYACVDNDIGDEVGKIENKNVILY